MKHVTTEIRDPGGRNVVENLRFENMDAGVDVMAEDLLRSGLLHETVNTALIVEPNCAAGRRIVIGLDNEKRTALKKRSDLTESS